jgi:hypothetical protein
MAVGSAYDLAFAVAMVCFPRASSAALRLPPPEDPTYLGLAGVLLILLAGMYALAARDPRRYEGIVRVAIAGRLLGAAYLGRAAYLHGMHPAFAGTALVDLALGAAHAALLARARRGDRAQVPEDARS